MKITTSSAKPGRKTYNVTGATFEEARKDMDKKRPGENGAYEYDIKMSWKGDADSKVTSSKITHTSTITMPKWVDYKKATKDDKAAWDKMYKTLDKHEDGHHDICVEELAAFKAEMEGETEMKGKAYEKEFKAFLDEVGKKQDKYDKRTDHGRK